MRTVLLSALVLFAGCSSSSLTAPAAADGALQPHEPATDTPEQVPGETTDTTEDETPPEEPPAEDPPSDDPPESTPADDPADPTPPPPPAPLECGPNALDAGGFCECVTDYTVCDASDPGMGCCAFGTDTFEVTFVRANVLPYADVADQDPWDWNGWVPGWMQDLIELVAVYFVEDATDWVDLLDYVYAFAPELLEGSTPPDPAIDVDVAGDRVFESSQQHDTLEPVWNETGVLTVPGSSDVLVRYHDVDFDFDDTILEVQMNRTDLQWLAGLGELTFEGSDGLYDFTLVIEPVF